MPNETLQYPFLSGKATTMPEKVVALPPPDRDADTDPANYLLDGDLLNAVNVALLLGQPLLVTGEPGTGKTQLAHRIAWELGYSDRALVFNTKSTSTARDLLYTFDVMGHFHSPHIPGASKEARDYLRFGALGQAIVHSLKLEQVRSLLRSHEAEEYRGPRRSVVLIDEIDKAPRDFPNDLLHEIDAMKFRAPELTEHEIAADPALRPVVVITSNSERNLPDAFLRRCVFHHIEFPEARLAEIVRRHLPTFEQTGDPLLKSAIDFLLQLRSKNLEKKPSTAELINWLQVLLADGAALDRELRDSPMPLRRSLGTLSKSIGDWENVVRYVEQYLKSPRS